MLKIEEFHFVRMKWQKEDTAAPDAKQPQLTIYLSALKKQSQMGTNLAV